MKIKGTIRSLLCQEVFGALIVVAAIAALSVKWDGITGMTRVSEILSPELKLRRAQQERIGDRIPQVLVHLMDEAGLKETLYEGAADELDLLKFLGLLEGRRPLALRADIDHYYARVVLEVADDPSWEGGPEDPNTSIEVLVMHPAGGSTLKEVELRDPLRWEGSIAKVLPRRGWSELEFLHMEIEFDAGGIKPRSGLSLGLR